jgi:hypothetical protein
MGGWKEASQLGRPFLYCLGLCAFLLLYSPPRQVVFPHRKLLRLSYYRSRGGSLMRLGLKQALS